MTVLTADVMRNRPSAHALHAAAPELAIGEIVAAVTTPCRDVLEARLVGFERAAGWRASPTANCRWRRAGRRGHRELSLTFAPASTDVRQRLLERLRRDVFTCSSSAALARGDRGDLTRAEW